MIKATISVTFSVYYVSTTFGKYTLQIVDSKLAERRSASGVQQKK